MRFISLIIALLWLASAQASPIDTYQFKNEVDKTRYQALVKELRCPKCQNQNLADSNSQIAVDLREQVYVMINEGKSDKEIVDYMVARYGDFVLYRPKVNEMTYILWFGPAVLLLIGAIVVVMIVRKKAPPQADKPMSEAQKQQLADILKEE
ncbi:cytochrome c-type biogenesis protein CcmH [Thalassotalea sp. LPB0316]|uniref:cytochrome c-type biogenesis protein n=1 Tax=Thalassotalea sp. LPB0316 TaxID=2769490 RepID=UPI001868F9B0|nr:cytochrome c-type biogenesis protein [Thalassotalea sp. LPB0316]QOL25866.1 cytochrome c-type biogenesis protein CcmH [Thalassotalea sp. LPB0316]